MAIQDELARALRGDVRADDYTRHLYAGDASMYASPPLLVAFPRDAADVAAAVRIAGELRRPGRQPRRRHEPRRPDRRPGRRARHLAPHGPDPRGRRPGRRARVGPGVVQDALNARRQAARPRLRPDTSTSNRATLGGMIGNNSSGSHSIVYGTTIDHVLELEVVLTDGSRHASGRSTRRSGAAGRGRHARGRDLPRPRRRSCASTPEAIAEDYPALAPVRRLPARLAARELRPRQVRHRLRGHARGDHRGDRRPDRAAEGGSSRSGTSTRSTRRSPPPRTRWTSTPRRSR